MIKLFTLDLENFMCVSKAHLDFTDQKVILLLGDNGNGKSTVLDAIALCLTETKRGDTYKDYIKRGEKESKVILSAEIKGFPILFDITINETGTALDRKVTYKGSTYVNSNVTMLLESLDLFYFGDIIMSTQGDTDITKLTPAKRASYLQKLLNFSFENEVTFCKNKLDELKNFISKNESQIDFNENSISIKKSQIQEVPNDIYSKRIDDLNNAINIIKENLLKYNNLIDKQNSLNNKRNKITNKKYSLSSQITSLEKRISELPQLKNSINDYDKKSSEYIEEVSKKNSEVAVVNNELTRLNTDKVTYDNNKNSIFQRKVELNSEYTTIKKHLDLIEKGRCPECGHEFTNADKTEYESKSNQLLSQIEILSKSDTDNQLKLDKIIEDIQKNNSLATQYNNDIINLNNNIKLIKTYKEKANNDIIAIENETKDLTKLKEDFDYIKNDEQQVLQEQENLNKSLNTYKQLNNDLQNAQVELSNLTKQLSIRENIIKSNQLISSEIKQLQNNISELRLKIEDFHKSEKIYKEVYTLLSKNFPDYLTVKTCDLLEQEMNNFIHIVFPNFEVKLFQNKKGVEFFYTTDKFTKDMKKDEMSNAKMASGFEKDLLSLSFKVALCKAYNLPFAFFDEADGHSSDKNAEKVFKSLFTNGIFEQVFLISHKAGVRDIVKSNADNVRTYFVDHGKFSLDSNY